MFQIKLILEQNFTRQASVVLIIVDTLGVNTRVYIRFLLVITVRYYQAPRISKVYTYT